MVSGRAAPLEYVPCLHMTAVVGTRYNPHVKAVYECLLARGKSKCPPSVPQCASWCICTLMYSKLKSRINTII